MLRRFLVFNQDTILFFIIPSPSFPFPVITKTSFLLFSIDSFINSSSIFFASISIKPWRSNFPSILTFPLVKFLIFFLVNAIPWPSFNSLNFLVLFSKFIVLEIDFFLFFFENLIKFSRKRFHRVLSSLDKNFFLLSSFCNDKFPILIIRF